MTSISTSTSSAGSNDLFLVGQRLDAVEHGAEFVARNRLGRRDAVQHVALELR
mgnify:CR=1 FL=1